jgi:flagellar biogenesis protein FliO
MIQIDRKKIERAFTERGGLAVWLLKKLAAGAQVRAQRKSRLALVDRISLAPRQSLVLVEAEGRRILVATSQDGGPAFHALDGSPASVSARAMRRSSGKFASTPARISW